MRWLTGIAEFSKAVLDRLGIRDERGTMSLLFAVTAVSLVAFVGMGTEAGTWYLTKRKAQNAADSAAVAGAVAIAWQNYLGSGVQHAAALAGANEAAKMNGFSTAGAVTVTPNNPPNSGAYTGNSNAVEVLIQQTQTPLISGLFYNGNIVIGTRAVAAVQSAGNACVLALTGGLSMGGNSTTTGTNCTLASNNTGANSIYIYGHATVSAETLVASGGCNGCVSGGSSVTLATPAMPYQPPTTDPFSAAQTAIQGYNFSSCTSTASSGSFSLTPYETSPGAYCGLSMTNSAGTVTLTPGTYFFTGNVTVHGGTLTCPTCSAGGPGVTIVLTGLNGNGNAGKLDINGNGTVNLIAPVTNSTNSAFDGILFFQDGRGSPSNDTINGTSTDIINGGMYFPGATVTINGTTNGSTTCTGLVAGAIDASGTADSYFDVSGCATYGTSIPQVQRIRLVE